VDETVQGLLDRLAHAVAAQRPDIHSQPGRASARGFPLFTYRTFDVAADHAIDPVVVGVVIEPAATGERLLLRADICGEESGRIFYALNDREVALAAEPVLTAAQELASQLSEQAEIVMAALAQPGPPEPE
jgi:hypothetical protein